MQFSNVIIYRNTLEQFLRDIAQEAIVAVVEIVAR